MAEPHVRLRDVIVAFPRFTLDIPALDLHPGEVVGVVGPNGSGKSTLLRLLPGLEPPHRGTVRVFGLDPVWRPAEVRSRLGFMTDDLPVFQVPIRRLLWWLSGLYPTWDRALADGLIARLDIDLDAVPRALSKGQATRLRLLLALAHRPDVVVLDEPATGLDVAGRQALLASILDVVQDAGRTVIISSHDLADVERIADRLVVLQEGRVALDGPTDAIVRAHGTIEAAVARGAR